MAKNTLEKKSKTPTEDSFQISREGLKDLLYVIKEEYKQGKNFAKNGGNFTIAEDFFMTRIGNLWGKYKEKGQKEYLNISSNAMNEYNKIVTKYQFSKTFKN